LLCEVKILAKLQFAKDFEKRKAKEIEVFMKIFISYIRKNPTKLIL
jgi:hypothetical protein